ncbi:hypothetical protein J3R82DRAFT_10625 [Butyriboletus roseoflavus]|nr:hypothetical protein J3R82DRAFT_10625 [Butyriboletus roseoflavus]
MSEINPHHSGFQIIEDVDLMEEINTLTELGTTLIQAILEKEPIVNIRDLIDAGAPLWFQDNEGTSPLHAAAYVGNDQLVKILLEEGALWNAGESFLSFLSIPHIAHALVDNLGNTAGDIALSMNNDACYTLIRDAGIRAELLLTLVSSKSSTMEPPSSLVIRKVDTSAAGSTDAFLASRLQYTEDAKGQEICLLKLEDGGEVGVMMGWEREIMRKTVDELCSSHPKLDTGLRVLNVGFGLGIVREFRFRSSFPCLTLVQIDTMFQSLSIPPSLHVIIEAHPDVLAHLEGKGWHEKENVKILNGKWQDVLPSDEFLGLGKFDVVYTDTFAEHYNGELGVPRQSVTLNTFADLHRFFKRLPDLLDGPDARFSFFNGLAATNALFYDVYTRVSDCHLSEIGTDVDWHDIEVGLDDSDPGDGGRWGETRKYFTLPIYRLPIAQLKKE